jgi:hypothetical protein
MLASASFAVSAQHGENGSTAAAATSSGGLTIPVTLQHVRYARLPCRRAPGPPLVSSASRMTGATEPTATSAAPSDASTAPLTQSSAGPAESLAFPAASAAATASSSTAASRPYKIGAPFSAAQQFLASSGASLLFFANSSFYLTFRNTLDGGRSDTSGVTEELTDAVQGNLLTSVPVATTLRERFSSGVDWKKLMYVRQQCRYTGEALVALPSFTTSSSASDAVGSNSGAASGSQTRAAVAAPAHTGTEGEKSVGARLMRSFLHPFAPSTIAPADSPGRQSPAAKEAENIALTVPHGEGVMTYVLYAMATPDYSPAPAPSSPFLQPHLIPVEFCPPLSELEDGAQPAATPTSTEPPAASRLLLLSLVVYEGTFEQGQRHGRGRLTAYGRFVLECTWVHDVPCLCVPPPALAASLPSSAAASAIAPPTLRRIHAHVCPCPSPRLEAKPIASTGPAAIRDASTVWSIRTGQMYMGSLALTAPARKRLLSRLEDSNASTSVLSPPPRPPAVMDVHGARYARLYVPPPSLASSSALEPAGVAAAGFLGDANAFSGLSWVDHVVLLPDGFGEAHYCGSGEEDAPARSPITTQSTACDVFHPLLWVPESARLQQTTPCTHPPRFSPPLAPSLTTQYCGEWKDGLPHGFGVELERVTDPASAPLALPSATAGAGPPQYPWRTLFLGQHVRGERRGPGTYHGLQGSDATEVVVCGSWPRGDPNNSNSSSSGAAANVVVLPPSTTGRSPASAASSFFTLLGARWIEEDRIDVGGRGGGTFPSATLRQSPAALSGMWEPLFTVMDARVAPPDDPLLFTEPHEATSAASPFSSASLSRDLGDAVWQHAQHVMDRLVESPECVSALRVFQACFACIYGFDTAAEAAAVMRTSGSTSTDGVQIDERRRASLASSGSERNATGCDVSHRNIKEILAHLQGSTVAAHAGELASLSYPWCPQHSWCGIAHLNMMHSVPHCHLLSRTQTTTLGSYTGCLHEPLDSGATHQQPTTRTGQSGGKMSGISHCRRVSSVSNNGVAASPSSRPRRPPLSAIAAALEPYAAAHTFAHAMHAAAAMVSSLRLRLLSCFAAHPNLCEVVMAHSAHDDRVLRYCWSLVYRWVGPLLQEKATAVAVADVRMVWSLLDLDRIQLNEQHDKDNAAGADGDVKRDVPVHLGWKPEGKETLRDYEVALRRCSMLTCTDIMDTSFSFANGQDARGAHFDAVLQCATSLARCFHTALWADDATAGDRDSDLGNIMAALHELHLLLCGEADLQSTEGETADSTGMKGSAAAAMQQQKQRASPAQREAMLRWLLLVASDPASHVPSASNGFSTRTAKHTGHPFALLLIASYLLGGRVTPSYPVSLHHVGRHGASQHAKPDRLLGVVMSLGYAARQLLHTYPSVRVQTFTNALAYPVDVLSLRLEYALSSCGACYLLSSTDLPAFLQAAPRSCGVPPQSSPLHGKTAETAVVVGAKVDRADSAAVEVQLDQIPVEVLQWCNEHLTDSVSENLLQTRLHRYWSGRITTAASLHDATSADGHQRHRGPDPSLSSPLVRWVLGCLQGALSAPVRQPAQSRTQTSPSTPSPTSSGVEVGVYIWKKFTNAVFFSPEEKADWAAAVASVTAAQASSSVNPMSQADYVYLVALAYTLWELCGVELSFAAQFVLQDDEEEEEDEDEDTGTGVAGTEAKKQYHVCPTDSLRDRKRNMFLSSSSASSASSSSESAVTVSSASSPPVESAAAAPATADARPVSSDDDSTGHHAVTAAHASFTPIIQHALSQTPSPRPLPSEVSITTTASTSSRARPHGHPQLQQRMQRGPSTHFVEGTTGTAREMPVGKEWTLTVRVRQQESANSDGQQKTAATQNSCFTPGILWEVTERVCAMVKYRTQRRKESATAAVPDKSHALQTSPR